MSLLPPQIRARLTRKFLQWAFRLADRDDLRPLLRFYIQLSKLPPVEEISPKSDEAKKNLQTALEAHKHFERRINKASMAYYEGKHPKHHLWTGHNTFILDNVAPEDRVLDIGCGASIYLHSLADKAREVIAIDINPERIKESLQANNKDNLHYHIMDISTQQPDGIFDSVVCSHVLEHLDDPLPILRKLKTITKKLIIKVPLEDTTWIKLVKRDIGMFWMDDRDHRREYTEKLLRQQLDESGWRNAQIHRGYDLRAVAYSNLADDSVDPKRP